MNPPLWGPEDNVLIEKLTQFDSRTLHLLRRLQFQTRALVSQGLTGSYRSAFRGQGLEFEEVREYREGDDIRSIDWKVTARANRPYVKSFREERQLSVMIVVDRSPSLNTGTHPTLKRSTAAEIAALLALIAEHNHDRVGLMAFAAGVQSYYPPRLASRIVPKIFRELFNEEKTPGIGTNFEEVGKILYPMLPRGSVIFVVSDFHGLTEIPVWKRIGREHDLNAFVVRDPIDWRLPAAGMMRLVDAESGQTTVLDLSSPKLRERYEETAKKTREQQLRILENMPASILELDGRTPTVNRLEEFLRAREKRRGRRTKATLLQNREK